MTEKEWSVCLTPGRMLEALRSGRNLPPGFRASERMLRLFVCACWRPRLTVVVEPDELLRDIEVVESGRYDESVPVRFFPTFRDPWEAARKSSEVGIQAARRRRREPGLAAEQQAALLRDLFGNPFRPLALDPSWLTPSVCAVAQAAYDERHLPSGYLDPTRLSVLADALEEAGCTDLAILDHCRHPGLVHVRGCWVVDLLIGRE